MEGRPDFSSLDRGHLYPGGLPPHGNRGGMLGSPFTDTGSGLAGLGHQTLSGSLSELARAGTPASLDPLAHLQSGYLPQSLPLSSPSKYF